MLSEEVCMFVSNACRLHTWHHDVMLSHFLLYSVTELSRRWWHFILVELHKICLKEEERLGVDHSFKKNYICLSDISRCCLIYSFKQVVRNSLTTFFIKKLECLYLWVYASTSVICAVPLKSSIPVCIDIESVITLKVALVEA